MVNVIIVGDSAEAGRIVAQHVVDRLQSQERFTLGVATGSTPLPVYRELAQHAQAGVDFSKIWAFALDEYVGLPIDHPESYHAVIQREVTEPLGIPHSQVHVPDGDPARLADAGARYEATIAARGGIDIQLLGIGTNGHVGFNEPGSSFASITRVQTLTEQTRRDNTRFFDSLAEVPRHCVTQGVGTILRANQIILMAWGSTKAPAVAAAVEGPVSASVPASVVQLHPHATVIVDEEAAELLERQDYYRWVQENRLPWQSI